jgi:hypothetical protein
VALNVAPLRFFPHVSCARLNVGLQSRRHHFHGGHKDDLNKVVISLSDAETRVSHWRVREWRGERVAPRREGGDGSHGHMRS